MSADDTALFQDVAAGSVNADGTAAKIRGATVAKSATGVYDVTVNPVNIALIEAGDPAGQGNITGALPQAEAQCIVTPTGAAPQSAQVEHVSDTLKRILLTDEEDSSADGTFSFQFRRLLG